jgi:hypothetical protein
MDHAMTELVRQGCKQTLNLRTKYARFNLKQHAFFVIFLAQFDRRNDATEAAAMDILSVPSG